MYRSLFRQYPYKSFQHFLQKIDPDILADHYAAAIEKEPLVLSHREGDEVRGAASLLKMSRFSRTAGMDMYLLKTYLAREDDAEIYEYLRELMLARDEIEFIVTKQPADNYRAINVLLEGGFYYVCGESVFSLDMSRLGEIDETGFDNIRPCRPGDMDRIRQISRDNHFNIRYYYDDLFDRKVVGEFFAQIACDSVSDDNQSLFVYEDEGRVVGFITLIFNVKLSEMMGREYGSLDYIALDTSHQKKSIGYALNNYALDHLRNNAVEIVSVKTMNTNYPAIRLLNRNGFIQSSQNAVLHYHRPG